MQVTEVGSFRSRGHADVAAGMLQAHGIPAEVRGDDAGGAAPHVAYGAHGYRLAVADEDAADAEELLAGDTASATDEPASTARVGGLHRATTLRLLVGALLVVVVVGVVLEALA